MNTILHYVRLNYVVILLLLAVLTVSMAVGYAMFNTFGWYALVFFLIAAWLAHAVSKGFINFIFN